MHPSAAEARHTPGKCSQVATLHARVAAHALPCALRAQVKRNMLYLHLKQSWTSKSGTPPASFASLFPCETGAWNNQKIRNQLCHARKKVNQMYRACAGNCSAFACLALPIGKSID